MHWLTLLITFLHLFFCSSFASAGPSAKIQGLTLQANELVRDLEKEQVELTGNVQIVKGDQHIMADRAILFLRSKKLELRGNVQVTTSTQSLVGDEILLDYETGTGLIKNGFVTSGNVSFEGDLLQKIGDDEFYVQDANYTACTNCPSTWSFTGQSIRAELGGYAYIKNSVMRIGGVPVLWLPYLVVPLKSDRQSGLLTPTLGSSEAGGAEFAQSYFWAIDRSQDMTLTLKNFEKRRLMGLANYRFVLTEKSKGELDTAWINDRVFAKSGSDLQKYRSQPGELNQFSRWYLYYQHHLELKNGWTQRMQIHNASDLRFPLDFEKEALQRGFSEPALENRVSFSKNTDSLHTSIDSSYYINLLRADPLSNNEDAVHRLPEISVSRSSQKIEGTPFRYNWDFRYSNFTRSFQPYDDLTASSLGAFPTNDQNSSICENNPSCNYTFDGQFNDGTDLIRVGQRFDFKPELSGFFRFNEALDIVPKISFRETQYFFPVGEDRQLSRRFIKTEVASRMQFSRVYGDSKIESQRYKHLIEPEVSYSNIPVLQADKSSFFPLQSFVSPTVGSATPVSDGDLNSGLGIQFDETDRILDRNLMTFSLNNRLIQRLWSGDTAYYRQVVQFKLSQSYNLSQESLRTGNQGKVNPWSDLAGLLNIRYENIETNTNFNYFPDQNVTNIKTRTAFINEKGQFFELGLEKTYTIVQGQPADELKRIEDISFGLGFSTRALNFVGQFVYDNNFKNSSQGEQIKSWGYIAQLKPPGECWQITFTQDQQVGGDIRTLIGFEFNFDGVPKPAPARSTLDQFRN